MTDQDKQRLFEQAVAWFIELQSENCAENRRRRFQAWLDADEAHRQAYQEAEALWSNLNALKTASVPGLADARAARPQRRVSAGAGLSALLLASLLAGWWQDYSAPSLSYETGLGERRHIDLADGSQLELNAQTRLTVRLSWLRRRIELQEGEVLFTVAHQSLRPFEVEAGKLVIEDIGTVFDVKKRPEAGAVSVLEGEVELRTGQEWFGERLKAGFVRRIGKDGHLLPAEKTDAEQTEAWTQGRLLFDHTPLSEVTAELERHHPVRFRFADPALARQTLSGNFDAADLEPFLQAIEKILPLRAKRQKQTIVLSGR